MGFFSKILDKLGFGAGKSDGTPDAANPTVASTSTAGAGAASTSAAGAGGAAPAPASPATATPPKPATTVDVAAILEQKAAANPQKLNWRTSIVDLLKLLDIDSSLQARKELATELGCPADLMGDSAKMNMWLHKAVMQKLAANGGKVPADLLD